MGEHIYFEGEEISMALRPFIHGYDLYHSYKVVIWLEYIREGKAKTTPMKIG